MSKDANKSGIGRTQRTLSFKKLQQASILILLAVLCAFASFRSPTFFSWTNLVDNLLTNAAALGIIAIGMTFVMIAGGFGDLRGKIIRIGHMGPGISDEYVRATLEAVEASARKQGIDCQPGCAVAAGLGK